jgi:hypothetical protein
VLDDAGARAERAADRGQRRQVEIDRDRAERGQRAEQQQLVAARVRRRQVYRKGGLDADWKKTLGWALRRRLRVARFGLSVAAIARRQVALAMGS